MHFSESHGYITVKVWKSKLIKISSSNYNRLKIYYKRSNFVTAFLLLPDFLKQKLAWMQNIFLPKGQSLIIVTINQNCLFSLEFMTMYHILLKVWRLYTEIISIWFSGQNLVKRQKQQRLRSNLVEKFPSQFHLMSV